MLQPRLGYEYVPLTYRLHSSLSFLSFVASGLPFASLFAHFLPFRPGPLTTLHLLSHIYVLRSQALWKEAPTLAWLQSQLPLILPDLLASNEKAYAPRQAVLDHFKNGTPESIVRHVMVAEDNSTLLGFLEPKVREAMGMAFDPLPPRRGVSFYDVSGWFRFSSSFPFLSA